MRWGHQNKVITIFSGMTEFDTTSKSANVGRSYERPMLYMSINYILQVNTSNYCVTIHLFITIKTISSLQRWVPWAECVCDGLLII